MMGRFFNTELNELFFCNLDKTNAAKMLHKEISVIDYRKNAA